MRLQHHREIPHERRLIANHRTVVLRQGQIVAGRAHEAVIAHELIGVHDAAVAGAHQRPCGLHALHELKLNLVAHCAEPHRLRKAARRTGSQDGVHGVAHRRLRGLEFLIGGREIGHAAFFSFMAAAYSASIASQAKNRTAEHFWQMIEIVGTTLPPSNIGRAG